MIHTFQQLQELELVMTRPKVSHEDLLSSITSTGFRKIAFLVTYTFCWRASSDAADRWTWVDEQLCGLADRLRAMGCRHTLEAELRFKGVAGDPEEHGFTNVLPEFQEKGLFTIIDADLGDRVIYSSAHDR